MSTATPTPQRHDADKPAPKLPGWVRNFTIFPQLGEPFDDAQESPEPTQANEPQSPAPTS